MALNLNLNEKAVNQPAQKITLPKAPAKLLKVKTKRKLSKKKIFFTVLLVIFLVIAGVVGVLYYKADQFFRATGLNVTPLETLMFVLGRANPGSSDPGTTTDPEKPKPELKKDEAGKNTNVLLVGLDTRSNGSLLNTDTIMIGSYNYEANKAVMFSIPRDVMVKDPNTKLL